MSRPGVGARIAAARTLDSVFESIRPRLELVDQFIAEQFRPGPETVQNAGGYVLNGGGKRLRPAVLLVVARMLGYQGTRDIRYGAVVEMIHSATLVHDDIIDHAAVRRGRPAANRQWGNQLTVLLGDWLYIRSMELALELGDVEVMRMLSRATMEMIEGEILGMELRRRADITVDQYLDIARRKTAELFAAACAIPSCFGADLERYRAPLEDYGRNLGICFQLVDDLLDLTASEKRLGKPVFSDLLEGTVTLPFILLLPRLSPAERRIIEDVLATRSLAGTSPGDLRDLLHRHRVLDQTRSMAAEFAERAMTAVAQFPDSPERASLAAAPMFILERDR